MANSNSMNSKKASKVSLVFAGLVLLVFFWAEILEIAFWGGIAFGIIFLLVKNNRKIMNGCDSFQQVLRQRINAHRRSSNDTDYNQDF